MSAVSKMLADADAAAASASGAVRAAIVDLRKEVSYLAGELNVGGSADAREKVFAAVSSKVAKLRRRLDRILDYQTAAAQGFAEKGTRAAGFEVKLSERRAKAVLDAVQNAGGAGMSATLTRSMEANVTSALRNAVVSAFNEQAIAGGTARDLAKVIRQKWEAALRNPETTTFVDRAGRAWNTDNYLMMNIRTNSMKVFNETVKSEAVASGDDLVRVTPGGDPDCDSCFAWEGRILSVTGKTKGIPTVADAEASGLFHPNCTHHLLPVDAEFAADELELQKQFEPERDADGNITPESADQSRYDIDIARKMRDSGVTAEEGRALVDRDNLENAIRHGMLVPETASRAVVDGLTDAQVNALCGGNGNPPEFSPKKDNGGEQAWNHGKRGGVLYLDPKAVTTDNLLKVSEVEEGTPYGPYKLAYKPGKPKEEPKPKSEEEIRMEAESAVADLIDRCWKMEFALSDAWNAFIDGPYRASSERAVAAYRSLVDAAYALGRGEDWLRDNVPQAKSIDASVLRIGEMVVELNITDIEQSAQAAQDAFDAARGGKGAVSDGILEGARTLAQKCIKAIEAASTRIGKLKSEAERLASRAEADAATGKSVIEALVAKEKSDGEVTRVKPGDIGLTAERIEVLKASPLADALKATEKLTDGVDKLQKAASTRISELRTEESKRLKANAIAFQPKYDDVKAARRAIRNGWEDSREPSVRFAAGLGVIASNPDWKKKWTQYERTQTKKGDYNFASSDFYGNPLSPNDVATRRLYAMERFFTNRYNEVDRAFCAARREIHTETSREIAKVGVIKSLGADNPGTVSVADVAPSRKKGWEAAKEAIEGFVDKSVIPPVRVSVHALTGDRSYCSYDGIHMSADSGVKTYVHEYAHFIERYNQHVHDRCREFLLMRAERDGTTTPESLRTLTGCGYRSDEVTLKDNFFNPYCGKVYGSTDVTSVTNEHGTRRMYRLSASEILSMGLERIYSDAEKFWREDREYFSFVTGVLQGRL